MITFKSFEHKNVECKTLLSTQKIIYQYICKFSMSCETPYPHRTLNHYNITIYLNDNFNLVITIYDIFYDEYVLSLLSDDIFAEKINRKMLLNKIQDNCSINWMINNIGISVIDDLIQCLNIFFERINILQIAGL